MECTGRCHCGQLQLRVPAAPEWLGSCNCSFCTKTGNLMAYYPDDGSVAVTGATATYVWGDRMIAHHRCPNCGSYSHWTSTGESYGRIGVNARLLDDFALTADGPIVDGNPVKVRFMDNAGD